MREQLQEGLREEREASAGRLRSEYERGRAEATREIVDSLTGLDKALSRVKVLEKRYLRKQPRRKYEKNVVYALTTDLSPNTYIVGSATNLENRLSSYNKTCEHQAVRVSPCGDAPTMKLMERMVLSKLAPFREAANRDRFAVDLPKVLAAFEEAEKFLV